MPQKYQSNLSAIACAFEYVLSDKPDCHKISRQISRFAKGLGADADAVGYQGMAIIAVRKLTNVLDVLIRKRRWVDVGLLGCCFLDHLSSSVCHLYAKFCFDILLLYKPSLVFTFFDVYLQKSQQPKIDFMYQLINEYKLANAWGDRGESCSDYPMSIDNELSSVFYDERDYDADDELGPLVIDPEQGYDADDESEQTLFTRRP
jgi:hypothetical protein